MSPNSFGALRKKVQSRKKKVVFVDDVQEVHRYTYQMAKELGLKHSHVYSPEQFRKILAQRLLAIRKLQSTKRQKLARAASPEEKRNLSAQIRRLEAMKKSPFDLVVSDINMPAGEPWGILMINGIKRKRPTQKVLVHSDDVDAMVGLERLLDVPYVNKLDYNSLDDLKGSIKRELARRVKKPTKKA